MGKFKPNKFLVKQALVLLSIKKYYGLNTIYNNQRFVFINKWGIFGYLVIAVYWLSNLAEKYAETARCLKGPICLN